VGGLTIWSSSALTAATAIVARSDQILVALRRDPTIEVSDQVLFTKDGTICRVIARIDRRRGRPPDGLCKIAA
jgi:hypothetical protein